MASTSQADFFHWPTAPKLGGQIDRNHKDFLPGAYWELLEHWLHSRASSTKMNSSCKTMSCQVLLRFSLHFFFFSHHQLYSQLFSCPAFGLFVVFLFSWLVPTTLPSYSFLQAYSMDNTFKSDFFVGSNIQKDIFLPIVSKILGLFVSLSILKLLSHSWNICFPSILLCPCLFKMMPETSVSCSYRPWNWPSAILVEYSEHRTYCELEESH